MLKHGFIASEDYFDHVLNADLTSELAASLIWESVKIKHSIVAEDPTEKLIVVQDLGISILKLLFTS